MEDPIKEFEGLKKNIDELRVRRMSDLKEKERLEKEFEELKAKIKELYGVEITDFAKAIADLREELSANVKKLKEQMEICKAKMGEWQ